MVVVALNFRTVKAERKNLIKGQINISNTTKFKNVRKHDAGIAGKDGAMAIDFTYTHEYSPDLGDIFLEGEILIIEEPKKIEEILKFWKTKKTLPPDTMTQVMNTIMNKCSIQSLILSSYVNLPPPIPIPQIEKSILKE